MAFRAICSFCGKPANSGEHEVMVHQGTGAVFHRPCWDAAWRAGAEARVDAGVAASGVATPPAEEQATVPRYLRVALANARNAFERGEYARLGTVNEDIQGLVDAAMSRIRTLETEVKRLQSTPCEACASREYMRDPGDPAVDARVEALIREATPARVAVPLFRPNNSATPTHGCHDLDQQWGGRDPVKDGPKVCVLWPNCRCGRGEHGDDK